MKSFYIIIVILTVLLCGCNNIQDTQTNQELTQDTIVQEKSIPVEIWDTGTDITYAEPISSVTDANVSNFDPVNVAIVSETDPVAELKGYENYTFSAYYYTTANKYQGVIEDDNIKSQLWDFISDQLEQPVREGGTVGGSEGAELHLTDNQTGAQTTIYYAIWYENPMDEGGPMVMYYDGTFYDELVYNETSNYEDNYHANKYFNDLIESIKSDENLIKPSNSTAEYDNYTFSAYYYDYYDTANKYQGVIEDDNIKSQLWDLISNQLEQSVYEDGSTGGSECAELYLTDKQTGVQTTIYYTIWYSDPMVDGGPIVMYYDGICYEAFLYDNDKYYFTSDYFYDLIGSIKSDENLLVPNHTTS